MTTPSSVTPKKSRSRSADKLKLVTEGDSHWSVGLRIWVEHRGRAVLGEGRADLLAEIERTHSISAAARAMKMSYRHAWLMVQSVNEAAGAPLVESAVGGVKGGGARLTERGRAALALFRRLSGEVRKQAATSLQRLIDSSDAPHVEGGVVRIAAAISLQETVAAVLTELALAQPTWRVHALYGASNELAEQIAGGAPIDLLLTGDVEHVRRLATTRLPAARATRRLGVNGLAVIVPNDSRLSASGPRELLQAYGGRIVVADPACPLGKCTFAHFAKLRLADRLRERALEVDNSRGVPAAVQSHTAEVGIAFSSDAAKAVDCRILFPIQTKQARVEYFGVVTKTSSAADRAAELLDFFTGESARRCFRRNGLGI